MRFWQTVVALGLILSAGLGLVVMSGGARGLFAPHLQAELVVQAFPLPPDMGVDPGRVAEFMARELQQRFEDDVAIRLMLPSEDAEKVRDIVLPRLMNTVAVQAMMSEIPELDALLDLGSFREAVRGQISSSTDATDVALTVPGALLATVDGEVVDIVTTSTGMTALSLGDMTAGESHQVVLWLDESAASQDLGRTILLGADGERGRVLVRCRCRGAALGPLADRRRAECRAGLWPCQRAAADPERTAGAPARPAGRGQGAILSGS